MKPSGNPMSDTGKTKEAKYAWRELDCQRLPKRSAPQRAADFLEIYGLYDEATAQAQANRCIQCPNPSCVNGCPLCNPIPQWMQLTAEGRFLEAAAVLGSATNLAEICTRLCPSDHLCEDSCILNGVSEPVAIGALEQFLAEYAFAKGQVDVSTAPPNGKKVAVVGSNPGALACADELARVGYAVTVFDSALVPGGLLVNGAPAFKIERTVIERRIEVLKKRGIQFQLGAQLWSQVTLATLQERFDAVYLGIDSRQARPLEIPGADLKGVVQAIAFLLQKNTPVPLDLPSIDISGKRVLIIGGGDTAMDCARAAIRYGAREVVCAYRRDEAAMPCGRHEYEDAREEGTRFVFHAAPVAILGNDLAEVAGVRFAGTELDPATSTTRPEVKLKAGGEFEIATDLVLLALGFDASPCPTGAGFEQLSTNTRGGLLVDHSFRTSLPGVFAGGDLVRGPGTILDGVRDARQAARHIHSHLSRERF